MPMAPQYPKMASTLQGRPIVGETVADVVRKQRDALLYSDSKVPLTGQYYDIFRATQQVRTSAPANLTNAYIRGIQNKAGGVKSFAASTYQYPSGQMVIGAALAGIPESPSDWRRQQLAGLGFLAPGTDLACIVRTLAANENIVPTSCKVNKGTKKNPQMVFEPSLATDMKTMCPGDLAKALLVNSASFVICKAGGTGSGGSVVAELPSCQCVESAPNGIIGYESGNTCRVTPSTTKCQGSSDAGGDGGGLSLGAKIGIGVGAVTVLGGLAYFLTRNKG
jgi:hypothetical protein